MAFQFQSRNLSDDGNKLSLGKMALLLGGSVVAALGLAAVWKFKKIVRMSPRSDLRYAAIDASDVTKTISGKTAFIVGGTKGIGAALALGLARCHVKVIIAGRADNNNVLAQLQAASPQCVHEFLEADVGSIVGAKACAAKFMKTHQSVDFLILTVGVLADAERNISPDGIERDFALSYLSRFIILQEMMPTLISQIHPARVYIMAAPGVPAPFDSRADPQCLIKYDALRAHMNTVFANEAMVKIVAKRVPQVAIFGLNPGLIPTDIRRVMTGHGFLGNFVETIIAILGQSMSRYVNLLLQIMASPELGIEKSGTLFNTYGEPIQPSPFTTDEACEWMWNYTEQLLQPSESI